MNIFKQAWVALRSYSEALRMIFSTQMWLAFAIPIALSIGLYYGGDMLTDDLRAYKFSDLSDEHPGTYLFLGIRAILVYVSKFMNKYLVLALLAPLMAGLSLHTEYLLTRNKYPFNWQYYVKDVVRALLISFRNMGIQLLWMAGFYLLTLIYALPNVVYEVLYFVIAFYFYGFSFMDYGSERRRLTIPESVKFTRKYWATAFVLGGVYGGLFWLPDFGMALQPGVVFAPIFGAVAGTIAVHHLVDLRTNPHAVREGEVVAVEVEGEAGQADLTGEEERG
jgi:CysZ protein